MKKLRIALFLSLVVMMFAGAQSVFATPGVYDGPASAKTITAGDIVSGYITTASDSDWYVITTSTTSFHPKLISPSNTNLDVQAIWIGGGGYVDSWIVSTAGIGGLEDVGSYHNGTDQVMYLRVFPHSSSDISSVNAYTLIIQ